MTLRSVSRTTNTYRAGDHQIFISTEQEWANPGTLPACLYSVGYTGRAIYTLNSTSGGGGHCLRTLGRHTAAFSIDAGGYATFGSDTAIEAIDQAVAWMASKGRPGPFLLVGSSMGFCDLMAWARTHQKQVLGAIGIVPAVNIDYLYEHNVPVSDTTGRVLLDAAYPPGYVPEVHGAFHSPHRYAGSIKFPVRVFYASDDPLIPPQQVVDYANSLPNGQAINLGPVGHTDDAQGAAADHPTMRNFLAAL